MLTSRQGEHWGNYVGFAASYVNGRIQNQTGLTYDASGNIINSGDMISPQDFQTTTFDAAGNQTVFFSSSKGRAGSRLNMITEQRIEHGFDGEGRPVKESIGGNFYHVSEQQPAMETAAKAYQV